MNTNTNAIGMSFKKKALIALCAFVAVVAIVVSSVTATIAYLTASASVINSFTVGNVTIKLDESPVLPNGVVDTTKTERVQSNTYELVPGRKYTKDPVLHVLAGSTSSFLFITVRNDLSVIANKTEQDKPDGIRTIAQQLKANGWAEYKTTNIGTVYVYVGTGAKMNAIDAAGGKVTADTTVDEITLSEAGDYKIFDYFSIDPNIKQEALAHYTAAKIIINAFAIQTTELDTVGAAWAALETDYSDVIGGLGGSAQE